MKTKKHKRSNENSHIGVANRPRVTIVRHEDGSIGIVGASAAAKFVGVSSQAFGRVVRRSLVPPKAPKSTYQRIADKVKNAYPELFNNPKIIEV